MQIPSFGLLFLLALATGASAAPATSTKGVANKNELTAAGKLLSPGLTNFDYAVFQSDVGSRQATELHAIMSMEGADDDMKRDHLLAAASSTPARPAVTGTALQNLKDYAVYAEIAYCGSASTLGTWGCGTKTCGSPAVSGTQLVQYLSGSSNAGFVAYNKNRNLIVVSFRGSSNAANWVQNLDFGKKTYPYTKPAAFASKTVEVHSGFVKAYEEMRSTLLTTLKAAVAAYPTAKVLYTGHSLGGAIATLAAADTSASGLVAASKVQLTIYNSPRVGSATFSDMVSALGLSGVARYVEENDIVSHLPPTNFGFNHVVGEDYQRSGVVYACTGAEDSSCSNSRVPFTSIDSHTQFFGTAGWFGSKGC
ncbi:hypothetical protein GGF32_009679 [Allomyces javanicus]|nr:hypothetical protein GGF32_009679 [Allomyces javanicus]